MSYYKEHQNKMNVSVNIIPGIVHKVNFQWKCTTIDVVLRPIQIAGAPMKVKRVQTELFVVRSPLKVIRKLGDRIFVCRQCVVLIAICVRIGSR